MEEFPAMEPNQHPSLELIPSWMFMIFYSHFLLSLFFTLSPGSPNAIMPGVYPREFYPFSGPTIYHQDDTFVRKPPRVHADEMAHEKLYRTISPNSHLTGTHFDKGRHHAFLDELNSQSALPNRHIFYETVAKKKRLDDEKGFTEEKYLKSRPFILERSRSHEKHGSTYYDGQYGGRRISGRYTPPQYSSPEETPPRLLWSRARNVLREPLAEFFGIFILVLFGDGSIAQVVLSKNKNGEWQSICWGWGFVLTAITLNE
ncbi:hypothetical protein Golomagni_04450 [Golovinomyces magnicellulatus]|nr:hypothetical protein Golomagni_04450 [Golovinomyces magnicellulatus]